MLEGLSDTDLAAIESHRGLADVLVWAGDEGERVRASADGRRGDHAGLVHTRCDRTVS